MATNLHFSVPLARFFLALALFLPSPLFCSCAALLLFLRYVFVFAFAFALVFVFVFAFTLVLPFAFAFRFHPDRSGGYLLVSRKNLRVAFSPRSAEGLIISFHAPLRL